MTETELLAALTLDRNHPAPLYHQLETQLERLMRNGRLRTDDRLPGDLPFSRGLGINTRTVRQALGRLAQRGLIRRRRRAGTFVTAAALRRYTIGFLYFEENRRMHECAEAIQQYAARHGHDLKIVAFPKTFYEQTDLLAEAERMGLKGLVTVPLNTPACKRNLQRLEAAGVPYVRLGNAFFQGELQAPLVRSDWASAMRHALDYLQALGHRRIGLIANSSVEPAELEPYASFAAAQGPFPDRWRLELQTDGALDSLYRLPVTEILTAYLDRNPDLTAVCATVLAADLATLAPLKGRPVPDRLSILGFGSQTLPEGRRLTALRSNFRLMAEAAAHRLFERITHGVSGEEIAIAMPMEMVLGDTVSAPLVASGIASPAEVQAARTRRDQTRKTGVGRS